METKMHSSISSSKAVGEKCAACTKSLDKKDFLRCVMCELAYDIACLNISSQRYRSFYALNSERKHTWKCPECLSKIPKQGNINTPVRGSASVVNNNSCATTLVNSINDDDQNVTLRPKHTTAPVLEEHQHNNSEEKESVNVNDSMAYLKVFVDEMRAMRQELSRMCDKMSTFTETINSRMDRLEQRMESIESRKSDIDNSKLKELEATVSQLKWEIQERDQEMLSNDIEVASFPESINENGTHVILTIANKLGVKLEERDVVNAYRAGPASSPVEGGAPPRPRPLVVRLARRAARDVLLRAARTRRGATTEGMSVPGSPRSFYLNERLTKANRYLFQKTRESAKRSAWKFVWTREGKTFVRKEQGTPSVRIRSEFDIAKVFGDCNVRADSRNVQ
jgi:hypothetical protein